MKCSTREFLLDIDQNIERAIDFVKDLDLEESLIVGGQEGIYFSRFCVNQSTAMKAAKTFVESGIMEKSICWEQDSLVEKQEFAKV